VTITSSSDSFCDNYLILRLLLLKEKEGKAKTAREIPPLFKERGKGVRSLHTDIPFPFLGIDFCPKIDYHFLHILVWQVTYPLVPYKLITSSSGSFCDNYLILRLLL
jgi:hypothetical protein